MRFDEDTFCYLKKEEEKSNVSCIEITKSVIATQWLIKHVLGQILLKHLYALCKKGKGVCHHSHG